MKPSIQLLNYKTKIGFANDLVEGVLNGSKTLTYRLGSKYADSLKKGLIVDAENSQSGQVFAKLQITEVSLLKMSQIQLDLKGHEKYSSLNELIASMQKHYPKEKVTQDSLVSLIRFEVL